MAQVQITQLPAAGPITGSELVPIVQNGVTKHTTTGAIAASPSQTQTFLTLNQEPTLPNSRALSGGTGVGLVDNGPLSTLQITLNGTSGSLETVGNGMLAKTSSGTVTNRTLSVTNTGLSVTNGDGVSGNPTFSLSGLALALAQLGGSGLVAIKNGTTAGGVEILGTPNQINVVDGNGFSGNPTISLVSNPTIPGTGAMIIPSGTSAQQPVGTDGQLRFNSETQTFDGYAAGSWRSFALTGGVYLINTGTGLTGGPITTTGTISIANTGVSAATYGSSTQVGQFTVNAQGQITSASNVTITPSSIGAISAVNGTTNEIDSSQAGTVVTLSLPSSLTFTSKTITGGTYVNPNISSIINTGTLTLPTITDTLVGRSTTDTLTNKTINGPDNTLTNIGNSSLVNSSLTYNGVTVSLGSSGTITAVSPYSLTVGTGLQLNSGTTYDGSAARTISIDSTVATLDGAQILTNKTISGASNTLSNIPNNALSNSSVTYNGVNVALGGSGSITAASPYALTAGTGLQMNTGTDYDGSSAKTMSIDSTVATLDGAQILTNKTISGSSNTLTNIGNSSLSNSSVTFNGATVSLGGSATITANTPNSVTFNNGGAGDASGTAFDGSAARTISYNTFGASPLAGSTSLTTLGTITTGVWNGTAIGNSYLANSSITVGTTSISLGSSSLTLGGLTSVTVTQNPTTDYQLATKQYVDNLVAVGTTYHDPVYVESPDTAGNLNAIYNNGTAGVGATLTNNGTLAALTIDGILMTVGKRVLIYNQTNAYENGVYTVTTVGDGSTPWVLTRAIDADSYGPGPDALDEGSTFFVQAGNTGAGETYTCTTVGTINFGTTAITFAQIGATQVYSAGTGLTLTGTTFSISNTGVSASTYGSASQVPVLAVNAQGQITSVTNTSIAIDGNQITSGTVGSSYLSGSYTGITGVGTLTAGAWNANTIGAGYGGTGLSSYTAGDLLYATASTTLAKLGIGTSTQILTSSGTAPQWTSPSSVSVGTATNLAGGTTGAISYQSSAGTTTFLSLGTLNYVLTAGATAPEYTAQSSLSVGAASNISGGTAGALPYNTASGTTTFLSLGATDYVLTAGATAPQYVAQSTLSVGSATTATNVAGGAAGSLVYQTGAGATTTLALGTTNYVLTAGATAPQYTAQSNLSVGKATNVAGGSTGAIVYNSAADTSTFLNLGTSGYVLTAGASAPQYVAQSTLSVGTATDAVNTGITLSSANSDYYITVVSTTTGNLPQLVATGLTANPSTGKITGGIAGGTF